MMSSIYAFHGDSELKAKALERLRSWPPEWPPTGDVSASRWETAAGSPGADFVACAKALDLPQPMLGLIDALTKLLLPFHLGITMREKTPDDRYRTDWVEAITQGADLGTVHSRFFPLQLRSLCVDGHPLGDLCADERGALQMLAGLLEAEAEGRSPADSLWESLRASAMDATDAARERNAGHGVLARLELVEALVWPSLVPEEQAGALQAFIGEGLAHVVPTLHPNPDALRGLPKL